MRKGLTVAIAVLAGAVALRAQQAPQPRIWQGVYTAAQAERGKATFLVTCQRCHNADLSGDRGPALKGERFMTTWGGGGVNRLFEKIRDNDAAVRDQHARRYDQSSTSSPSSCRPTAFPPAGRNSQPLTWSQLISWRRASSRKRRTSRAFRWWDASPAATATDSC
jgi:hypothetical protein